MRELAMTGKLTLYDVTRSIAQLIRGETNAKTTVTLTASTTTTTISHDLISPTSAIFLSPLTANAAAALATTYVSAVTYGQATLTHANNTQTDRDFDVIIKTGEI